MSRTAHAVHRPDRRIYLAPGRPESADFNYQLLAALAACAGFWVVVALTVSWLIF
jgi:hypothetical protein